MCFPECSDFLETVKEMEEVPKSQMLQQSDLQDKIVTYLEEIVLHMQ